MYQELLGVLNQGNAMMRFVRVFLLLTVLLTVLALPALASDPTVNPVGLDALKAKGMAVVNWFLGLADVVIVTIFVFNAFKFAASGSNPQAKAQASQALFITFLAGIFAFGASWWLGLGKGIFGFQ